jgi:hypothetical protein
MEGQSKRESIIETCLSTASGFILSYFFWIWFIAPVFHLPISHGTNFLITLAFTGLSLVRGYFWRRFFAKGLWKRFLLWGAV